MLKKTIVIVGMLLLWMTACTAQPTVTPTVVPPATATAAPTAAPTEKPAPVPPPTDELRSFGRMPGSGSRSQHHSVPPRSISQPSIVSRLTRTPP